MRGASIQMPELGVRVAISDEWRGSPHACGVAHAFRQVDGVKNIEMRAHTATASPKFQSLLNASA
jgi:hypothetical protein